MGSLEMRLLLTFRGKSLFWSRQGGRVQVVGLFILLQADGEQKGEL